MLSPLVVIKPTSRRYGLIAQVEMGHGCTLVLWVISYGVYLHISYGVYPRTEIMKMSQANLRKTNTNTKIFVKNLKGKNNGEGEKNFTIIMAITMVILWRARVFGLN